MKRLRLVKLVVQPHFVIDDGEHLEEKIAEPMVLTAAELDSFPERFAKDLAFAEEQLNAEKAEPESS